MSDDELILVAAALLAAGIAASLASRIRLPGLLLFLAIGMAIGSDGLGWIDFNDYELARTIGVVALALILFEGGLTAGFDEIRPVLRPSLLLAVIGTLVTAVICGFAAAWLFDLSTLRGDAARRDHLVHRRRRDLRAPARIDAAPRPCAHARGRGGFNDPVAVLLVIGFIEWIEQEGYGVLDMALLFVREMGIGAAVGLAVGLARGTRSATPSSRARACTRSRRYPRPASLSAAPRRCTAPGSSPYISPGSRSARGASPRSRR